MKQDRQILFVGECRSLTAIRKGWTWKDGRLAAKVLFEALRALGVDPTAHQYVNLWTDPPYAPTITAHRKAMLRATDKLVVALGKKVSDGLTALGIDHVALVHPAARGKIRKASRYRKHVKDTLGKVLAAQKIMRVRFTETTEEDSWIEIYHLQDAAGRFRRRRDIPGNGQYAPNCGEIAAWFKSLGVTHVETYNNYHPEMPDGVHTLAKFARWMRAQDREALA